MAEEAMAPRRSLASADGKDPAWIDCAKIDAILSVPMRIISSVDGSEASMCGFEYVIKGLMNSDREAHVYVTHVYDESKTYLPPAWRKDSIRSTCEAILTSTLLPKRYDVNFYEKRDPSEKVGAKLIKEIEAREADFICMGWRGRKERKAASDAMFASNVMSVMEQGKCTTIVIQSEEIQTMPLGRPTVFVVSASLNQASTKAFIDALRLSKPGDQIHVIYVKSYLERAESDYTMELRAKYAGFFEGLRDSNEPVLSKYGDRNTTFTMLDKRRLETTAQAVARHCDTVDADFVVVGTNTMRIERGKSHLGSVSRQIILDCNRNFIVSNWTPGRSDSKDSRPSN
mmetsp:Transcript_30067/g.70082  ORF Transcript_30067/g.70082 Transcript_30067/m.70082 type:complete len:343 (-) Transcript_30067:110-1138(-)